MDDDWDALGGASDTAPAPIVGDADPFGGDDDVFGAPAPAAAPTDGGLDDMFGGGDASAAPAGGDDIFSGDNGFGGDNGLMGDSSAPEANGLGDMFDAAPAAAAPVMSEPVPQEDNSLIEEWERKKREELQKRREESARQKSLSMEVGQKALADFDAKRKTDVERAQAKNRTDEKDTIAAMEAALKAGLSGKESWEKVTTFLDLSSDPKRNNTISRMKSVLIAIKTTPPSDKKNFGA